jgi:hypothetical protein
MNGSDSTDPLGRLKAALYPATGSADDFALGLIPYACARHGQPLIVQSGSGRSPSLSIEKTQ